MRIIIVFSFLCFVCQTKKLQAQIYESAYFYHYFAPYPKTPFTGEFSVKRITADVDTLDYSGYVGGRVYWAISRSDDGRSDIFQEEDWVSKRTYDEKDRLLHVAIRINENEWDTLMRYTYDDAGRILKREELWPGRSWYRGCYYDDFIVGNTEEENAIEGLRVVEYDYDKNLITQDFIHYDNKDDGVIDTIKNSIISQVRYTSNGFIVTTNDHEEQFIFSGSRLIQAGDVSYSYSSNGFTEKKDALLYEYTFNKNGLLQKATSNEHYHMTFRYTESTVSNEYMDAKPLKISYTAGQLRILSENDIPFDVAIYNIQGMFITQSCNKYNEAIISLENMPSNVYIVHITSGKKIYTQKLYKK